MSTVLNAAASDFTERQIAGILQFRFGDGLVYLPKNRSNYLYSFAKKLGFINIEGYLTRKGRILLARYYYN